MIQLSGQALQGFLPPIRKITGNNLLPYWGYQMKICKKCGSNESYACGACKPCAIKRASAWHIANPDKSKAAKDKYALNNKDKVKAAKLAYIANNPEKIKAAYAKYREENYQKELARSAKWRASDPTYFVRYHAANIEKSRDRSRNWYANNKERQASNSRRGQHNRRARLRNVGGKLSSGLAEKLYKIQRGKCACCGNPLGNNYHLDHRVPLALGGANEDWNMQLLRNKCNLSKGAKHPIDFMQRKGFLL